MYPKPPQSRKALLLTVGTGDINRQKETLFEPLKKSIREGEWQQIMLLPSQQTVKAAKQLVSELKQDVTIRPHIQTKPLPQAGDEEDVNACFAHFDSIIKGLIDKGFAANEILIDFTRGTKSMSAALVMAAILHDIPRLRYITGKKRNATGAVIPGTELIKEVSTISVNARKILAAAEGFLRNSLFSAALELLPDPDGLDTALWTDDLINDVRTLKPCATFYAHWDRFDYKSASDICLPQQKNNGRMSIFIPSKQTQKWVSTLAAEMPVDFNKKATWLRRLAVDLLANGERRILHRQYEDALLRAYRVLELAGQVRLFEKGLDSANLPREHEAVKKLQEKLRKKNSAPLSPNKNGTLKAGRENVARLLKILNDPFGKKLLKLAEDGKLKAKHRNKSILTHAFEAVSREEKDLRELYSRLEDLLKEEGGKEVNDYLKAARSADLSKV